MSMSKSPVIPFFPLVMKDVTFLNDGNQGVRPSEPELINFDKYRNLCAVLGRYAGPAAEPYEFSALITPLLRGLPVVSSAVLGGSVASSSASVVTRGGEGGMFEGLASVSAVAGFVEGRIGACCGEAAMGKAWEALSGLD
ncbi:hypothetical protein HDU67_004615, partial [Dinochytrium kinnereticum]